MQGLAYLWAGDREIAVRDGRGYRLGRFGHPGWPGLVCSLGFQCPGLADTLRRAIITNTTDDKLLRKSVSIVLFVQSCNSPNRFALCGSADAGGGPPQDALSTHYTVATVHSTTEQVFV